jgi:hypothetical protein
VSTEFDASRRKFLVNMTIAGGALHAWPALSWNMEASVHVAPAVGVPVVSFHMDQPYLDLWGTAQPYLAPEGVRAAEPFCPCDDVLLRHHHCYSI